MNQENFEYLSDRAFYLGFGSNLEEDLRKNMEEGKEKFQLPISGKQPNGDVVKYEIDFGKSSKNDLYFLNTIQATLVHEDPAKQKTQKFFINRGNGATAKEMYNMLHGRSVYKTLFKKPAEGQEKPERYKAWLTLNFKEKDKYGNHKLVLHNDKWGFDLGKGLDKAVKEHHLVIESDTHKALVMESLKKGNLVDVAAIKDDKKQEMFLAANPKNREVSVYDKNMKKQLSGGMKFFKPGPEEADKTAHKIQDPATGDKVSTKNTNRKVTDKDGQKEETRTTKGQQKRARKR